jgi:hypothetical protein
MLDLVFSFLTHTPNYAPVDGCCPLLWPFDVEYFMPDNCRLKTQNTGHHQSIASPSLIRQEWLSKQIAYLPLFDHCRSFHAN